MSQSNHVIHQNPSQNMKSDKEKFNDFNNIIIKVNAVMQQGRCKPLETRGHTDFR